MLHSMQVEMIHPATGEPLVVRSSVPADFLALFPDADRLLTDVE
jgi:hypothetical protein